MFLGYGGVPPTRGVMADTVISEIVASRDRVVGDRPFGDSGAGDNSVGFSDVRDRREVRMDIHFPL